MTDMSDHPAPPPEPPPPRPVLSPAERRARAAADALRTLVRDLHISRFGPVVEEGEAFALALRLTVRPSADWAIEFDPPLSEQLETGLQDARADRGAFRKGSVYCFRCRSSLCDHARPPACRSVFAAYGPTGLPEWRDFAQALLDLRDSRVDRLFESPPSVLAAVQLGHELRVNQLSSFGRASKTYAILGQVIAGHFPARAADPRQLPERVALTFQAVETRDAAGAPRLVLNLLGCHPSGDDIADALASGWEPPVFRAREIAARELESADREAAAARAAGRPADAQAAMRRIPAILRRLADSLQRGGRQAVRRTRHAEQRRTARRPVHKALEDALGAAAGALYRDDRSDGFIALGEQGRAHVFNAAGRHITSFTLKPGAAEFRARTGRWKPLAPDEADTFRQSLRAQIARGTGDEPDPGGSPASQDGEAAP